jgi:hypothetical protein
MLRSARAAARTSATLAHALTRHAHVAATAAARQHPAHGAPQFIAWYYRRPRPATLAAPLPSGPRVLRTLRR